MQFGKAFTDTGVVNKKDLSGYRIVYFATHGLLDEGNPCLHTPCSPPGAAAKATRCSI
jgi:hypothetical protein